MLGRITAFNADNGTGLIEMQENKEQLFFSYQQFQKIDERDLKIGALVEVMCEQGTGRLLAFHYPMARGRSGLFLVT